MLAQLVSVALTASVKATDTKSVSSFNHFLTVWGQKWTVRPSETIFSQKNGLKTTILGATILDRLTSEGAGTQIFKGIANFSMCFEKIGTLSSK